MQQVLVGYNAIHEVIMQMLNPTRLGISVGTEHEVECVRHVYLSAPTIVWSTILDVRDETTLQQACERTAQLNGTIFHILQSESPTTKTSDLASMSIEFGKSFLSSFMSAFTQTPDTPSEDSNQTFVPAKPEYAQNFKFAYVPNHGNSLVHNIPMWNAGSKYVKAQVTIPEVKRVVTEIERAAEKRLFHHAQTYLIVERKTKSGGVRVDGLIGCLGISAGERDKTSLLPQRSEINTSYYALCTQMQHPDLALFASNNWKCATLTSTEPVRIDFLAGYSSLSPLNPEHKELQQLIMGAQHSLYIESRLFVSTKTTKNQVGRWIVDRLVRALFNNKQGQPDPFKCIILTNGKFSGSLAETNLSAQINETLDFIQSELMSENTFSAEDITKHLFIGYLIDTKQSCYHYITHTLFIVDESIMVLGNNTIHDSSALAEQNTHVSCIIKDQPDVVKHILYQLLYSHINLAARGVKFTSLAQDLRLIMLQLYSDANTRNSSTLVKRLRKHTRQASKVAILSLATTNALSKVVGSASVAALLD